jgi:hypothetical protein
MNRKNFKFTEIFNKEIHKMLEKDLNIEMYDANKDVEEDWGIGRTLSTCKARITEINGKQYLHIISKNPFMYGKEERIYSYDIQKKEVCKVSQIKKNISDETYKEILNDIAQRSLKVSQIITNISDETYKGISNKYNLY